MQLATLQQQAHLATHHADVAPAGSMEGVSLELYAEVMARIAGGEDHTAILAEKGLTGDQWQRAQTAWNGAMAKDTDHHITTQYGMLYARFSPGAHQQRMHDATMAARRAAMEADDEPDEDYTFEDAVREMSSTDRRTRWTAAHHVSTDWDIGERGDADLDAGARTAIALAREALSDFDKETVGEAEALASDLQTYAAEGFLGEDEAEAIGKDLERALARARAGLEALEAELAPIRDRKVPERVRLQSAVQDYTSFVEEVEEIVEEWADTVEAGREADEDVVEDMDDPPTASEPALTEPEPQGAQSEGPFDMLKGIPVIGDLVRALGL